MEQAAVAKYIALKDRNHACDKHFCYTELARQIDVHVVFQIPHLEGQA